MDEKYAVFLLLLLLLFYFEYHIFIYQQIVNVCRVNTIMQKCIRLQEIIFDEHGTISM